MTDRRLFWFSCYDLEPIAARSPQCGGPETWAESEAKIKEIAEAFRSRGVVQACLLNATPEAAKVHADLLRSLAAEGFHIGIQPNVPAFRYPTYDRDLGLYSAQEQREIIKLALADFEDALGMTTTTYTPCCGSRSNDWPSWAFGKCGCRHRADGTRHGRIAARWGFSRHRTMPVPSTGCWPGTWTCTYSLTRATRRASTSASPGTRRTCGGNTRWGRRRGGCTGKSSTRTCAIENVEYVLDYIPQAAEKYGLQLVPAGPEQVHAEADKIGAF